MAITFRNKYDVRDRVYCEPGNPEHPLYTRSISEDGVPTLVETGKVNIPDEINSHAASVDINNILSRFNNGDVDVLNQRVGQYFDASGLPNNLADMYRTVQNGEDIFNRLPLETRQQFNFSFTEFISSIGTEKFDSVFNPVAEKDVIDKPVKEVIDNVEKL